jgi:hypothetical protein
MSLAYVTVTPSDFDLIYGHLESHKPPYRNMHMREACQRSRKRDLRYLHGMYARPGVSNEIEGMISGPEVFWHYKIVKGKLRTQLRVLREWGSPEALDRIGRRFFSEVMNRIAQEREGEVHYPKRTPGQFYLRRSEPGMVATHPTCRRAVTAGVLDQRFVSQLLPWGLELLGPQ